MAEARAKTEVKKSLQLLKEGFRVKSYSCPGQRTSPIIQTTCSRHAVRSLQVLAVSAKR